MEYYLFFCLFVMILCLIYAKTAIGEVTVGTVILSFLFSIIPILNVLTLLFVSVCIVVSRPWEDLMRRKLF